MCDGRTQDPPSPLRRAIVTSPPLSKAFPFPFPPRSFTVAPGALRVVLLSYFISQVHAAVGNGWALVHYLSPG